MSLKIKKNIPLIDQNHKNFMYGGKFGGNYIPETLKKPINDLTRLFSRLSTEYLWKGLFLLFLTILTR